MEEKGFKKLIVWKRMQELILLVYKITEGFPKSEMFGLQGQMRRAAVSIVSNFAEGYLKRSTKEKQQFLERSQTSLQELMAQIEVCLMLRYVSSEQYEMFEEKRGEVGYLLYRYMASIPV
jgi:four helix bundle protein